MYSAGLGVAPVDGSPVGGGDVAPATSPGSSGVDLSGFCSDMAWSQGASMIGSAVNAVLGMAGSLDTAATNATIQKEYYATQEWITNRKRDMAIGAINLEVTKMDKAAEMQGFKNASKLELAKARAEKDVVKAELAEQKATAKASHIERRERFYGNAF